MLLAVVEPCVCSSMLSNLFLKPMVEAFQPVRSVFVCARTLTAVVQAPKEGLQNFAAEQSIIKSQAQFR